MDSMRTKLASLEYPGRLIVIGAAPDGGRAVIIYAITGRSPSSQARRLVLRDGGIWVEPTDEATLKQGHVDLLVYPAVLLSRAGLAVSNGKQTTDVRDRLAPGAGPVPALAAALASWDFEPDAPIFTPRISGCLAGGAAGLSVVRRGPSGETLRNYFEAVLRPGEGRLVSTYEGPNADPLPVFRGEPRFVDLAGSTAAETAEDAYRSLGPEPSARDFRVAVACVFVSLGEPDKVDVRIINRHERT
ncbi:MAG: IMP cyclohydrolase [Candidatus Aminicenantales bacterium]